MLGDPFDRVPIEPQQHDVPVILRQLREQLLQAVEEHFEIVAIGRVFHRPGGWTRRSITRVERHVKPYIAPMALMEFDGVARLVECHGGQKSPDVERVLE